MDRIFEILCSKDEVDDAAFSQLGLRLNEQLVLEVLRYGFQKREILSCLKFFDWAGRQPGFYNRRSAFQAILKILSRSELTPLLLDFLDNARYRQNTTYRATLVMGYSIAGKPRLALQLFGEMRFLGQDVDIVTYHVLLRSLVENDCFDAAKQIAKQISTRGFENHVTHTILVKSLCKQKMLDVADSYLRQVIQFGGANGIGAAVGVLLDALCRKGCFDKAEALIGDFKGLGVVPTAPAYNVWLRNLVQANELDESLEFLKEKRSLEGYVPDSFHYHRLLSRLLKDNRLTETCDLLMNMMEEGIPPDEATMNVVFCFFCKCGMVDVALELYKCRSGFSYSPSGLSCSYLINNLCREGHTDEAYNVFKNCAEQGYFPGLSVLFYSFYREGKLDKMEELVRVALKRNMMPSFPIYDKLISALCRAGRYDQCFSLYEELGRSNNVGRSTYSNLIRALTKLNRGNTAARILIEMQEKGHIATRAQFRVVIRSLCDMPDPERQFLNLLGRQLSNNVQNCEAYNNYIDGAAHAEKPHLARVVFELMKRRGIQPNLNSFIIVLRGYLKSNRISDALKFFDELRDSIWVGRKLFNVMIVGLSEANREDIALIYWTEMRSKKMIPTNECYEMLVRNLCYKKQFDEVVDLVKNLDRDGRQVTTFLGNTLLLHCLKGGELYDAWIRKMKHETSTHPAHLGQLIGAFSGRLRVSQKIGHLEEMIKQCFSLDLFTHNMLLRRLSTSQMDDAVEWFGTFHLKGFEPDLWSYYILICGLLQHGRTDEAKRLANEMTCKGFCTTKYAKLRKLIEVIRRNTMWKYKLSTEERSMVEN